MTPSNTTSSRPVAILKRLAIPMASSPTARNCRSIWSSRRDIRSGSKARRCSRRRWRSSVSRSRSRSSSWRPGSTASSPTDEYDLSWDYHFQRAVDPAWTLSLAFFYPPGPQNISRYTDEQITELINAGGTSSTKTSDGSIYFPVPGAMERDFAPASSSASSPLPRVSRRDVEGFVTDPLCFQDFRTVWLNR